MKSFLVLLLIFCSYFIVAQTFDNRSEQKLKQESKDRCFYDSEKNISDSTLVANLTREIENEKSSQDTKKDKVQSAAIETIDIVQEINAVLNYKINRIWRRDLYCFACEIYHSGKVA